MSTQCKFRQSPQNLYLNPPFPHESSTFWPSFSVGFNCSEEGRPPSVTEKSQSASSSPQGPRRNWSSPSHSIHGSETHRKHSELLRRTSTASGTKHNFTYTCTHLSFNLSTIIIQVLEFFYIASFDFWGEIWSRHVQ